MVQTLAYTAMALTSLLLMLRVWVPFFCRGLITADSSSLPAQNCGLPAERIHHRILLRYVRRRMRDDRLRYSAGQLPQTAVRISTEIALQSSAVYIPELYLCAATNLKRHRPNTIVQFSFDLSCLGTMSFFLIRSSGGGSLWTLIVSQVRPAFCLCRLTA